MIWLRDTFTENYSIANDPGNRCQKTEVAYRSFMSRKEAPEAVLSGRGVKKMGKGEHGQIEGMFLIIDRRNDTGLKHWGDELERREIPALIQVDEYMVDNHPELIKSLGDKGFEIGGGYNKGPFWNEPHNVQYEEMIHVWDRVQSCVNKPMRVVNSKYFAYDEITLKVADEVGVEYILVRGTAGAKAVVYRPEEYDAKIISVSNVPSEEMGTGSLCDESLWCRGVTPEGFREVLFALEEERVVVVAQTHLSGVKLNWWNVYQDFFDAGIVQWKSLDEFSLDPIVRPNEKIPVNTEVEYLTPMPAIPLEQEPDYPFDR
jgi:hypothetical protein